MKTLEARGVIDWCRRRDTEQKILTDILVSPFLVHTFRLIEFDHIV